MDDQRRISQYEHENALMHYGRVNKRSMIMLITVCVTCILMSLIFVSGYSRVQRSALETIERITSPTVTGVEADGVYQQPDP